MSGPIRRGKTFFMGGYQGFYENIPFPVTRTIPTAAQLRGDFSQTTTANGTPILIYDPATTVVQREPQLVHAPAVPRQHDSGEPLEPDREGAAAVFSHGRTRRRATSSGSSNFVNSPNLGRYRYNSYLTRIDHVFSDSHRLSFSNSATGASSSGTRTPCRSRRSGATTTRRTATTTCRRSTTTSRSARTTLWNTRVVVGPVRRAARQGVRQRRSRTCRSRAPTS